MADLVTEYAEVKQNVRQFNQDLEANAPITEQLSQFIHWYFIPELDQFGPSKFIGYKMMTSDRYNRGSEKDGRTTERALRKWFEEISEADSRYGDLLNRLENLLEPHGKRLRSDFKIHVPK
jgi:hypothetical protein